MIVLYCDLVIIFIKVVHDHSYYGITVWKDELTGIAGLLTGKHLVPSRPPRLTERGTERIFFFSYLHELLACGLLK